MTVWRRYLELAEDEPLVSEPIGSIACAVIWTGLLIGLAYAGMA